MKNLPIHIKIVIVVLSIAFVFGTLKSLITPAVDIYNKSKVLSLSLDQKIQYQITNYDGYYLAFSDKQQNAGINKDTFIEVTNIIMSNRKDGQNVAWKWMQENQQIPYSEFTIFYKELSSFISERYSDNMRIEGEKQQLVQEHNTMLQTFPNNLYNRFLKIDPLVYKFGYVSEKTKETFKN